MFNLTMEKLTTIAQLLSSIAFFFYGASCLLSKKMIVEFDRYGLPQFRVVTGVLQVLGSIGLALGFFYSWIGLLSSLGLSLQMFSGVIVRIRIKDPVEQAFPALFFCILNLFIFWRFVINLEF